jgi:hypothetical protein
MRVTFLLRICMRTVLFLVLTDQALLDSCKLANADILGNKNK